MSDKVHHTFESPAQLHAWLQANHASEPELWVRIYKKATGQPQGPCWCTQVDFSADLLSRIPAQARDQACVCAACAGTGREVLQPE